MAGAVLSLVSVLIVARVLGPEGRGNVAYLTSLAWFTASLFTFGLQEANANLGASEPESRPSLATNSIVLSIVFGALAVGLLAGLIALVPAVGGESSADLRWATLAFVPLLILQICLRFLVQADYAFTVANASFLLEQYVAMFFGAASSTSSVLLSPARAAHSCAPSSST